MKQLEVQIMGQSYVLGCPENSETRLRSAVEKVDGAMCKVRDAGRIKARDRIAVLVALNLAFESLQTERVAATVEPEDMSPAPGLERDPGRPELDLLLRRLDTALAGADDLRP